MIVSAAHDLRSVVDQVQFAYNDFGQLTDDYQSHSGAVNTSTTPKVQYDYADGSDNTIRPTSLTYPDGREITYGYGTSDDMNDAASRVESLIDSDAGSTHLADYSYLGLSAFVVTDYTEPDVKWTMVDLSASNDPDTGDIYSGLDRFGRVKDNRWYDYGSSADVDRIKYGYDRAGNRLWRENEVARSLSKEFDELYSYDGLYRLQEMQRGTLNSGHTALTSKTFAQDWALDPTGNWGDFRQDDDGNGTWNLDQQRTANKVNEITGISETAGPSWVTPAYSAAGNMTTVPQPADPTGSFTATYDAWNRLVKLVDGSDTVQENEYDARRFRIVRKDYSGGSLDMTRHVYFTQNWQAVEERVDTSSDAERQFVWGRRYIDDIVVRDRDTTANGTLDERLYGMQDANWNTTTLSESTGTVVERFAYDPYGRSKVLDSNFTPVSGGLSNYDWGCRFTGRELDVETGLQYFRARHYHDRLGVFLTRDPIHYSASEAHLYSIGGNRAVNFVDPSGQDPQQNILCSDGRVVTVSANATPEQIRLACAPHHPVSVPSQPPEELQPFLPTPAPYHAPPRPECIENGRAVDKVPIWVCNRRLGSPDSKLPAIGPISHSFVCCKDPATNPNPSEETGEYHCFGKQPRPLHPGGGDQLVGLGYVDYEENPVNADDCKKKMVCPAEKRRMCQRGYTEDPFFIAPYPVVQQFEAGFIVLFGWTPAGAYGCVTGDWTEFETGMGYYYMIREGSNCHSWANCKSK